MSQFIGAVRQHPSNIHSVYASCTTVSGQVRARAVRKNFLYNVPFISLRLQHNSVIRKDQINGSSQYGGTMCPRKSTDNSIERIEKISFQQRNYAISAKSQKQRHRVFVALGSNMGDRFDTIERACDLLEMHDEISIRRTSGLWETKAMYVVNQADFLNGVCEIETTLDPIALLDQLQAIENQLDRKKTIDKGPRTIDLDILLYDDAIIEHERLTVPHKLMLERAFVLQPLCELIPDEIHPTTSHTSRSTTTYSQHLSVLPPSTLPLSPLIPLSPTLPPLAPLNPLRKTHIMSILNTTPDSFSDGGRNLPSDLAGLHATIQSHLEHGATIIDVGGQSTRPHAPMVTAEEEIERILPAIQHLSSLLRPQTTTTTTTTNASSNDTSVQSTPPQNPFAISTDTFRSPVALASVTAGSHILNDISAGTLDPAILRTAARAHATLILMHMRGDPSTMTSAHHTSYPDGLIPTVASELLARIRAAEEAGVRRWRICLDPGIGFAKTASQNLHLLRELRTLRVWPGLRGLPWVVGVSRKGFLGKLTGVAEAKDRVMGTAAAVAAAVAGGADVVRVHDVEEMRQVVRVAEAVWRV